MSLNHPTLQQAIEDIALIKRAVVSANPEHRPMSTRPSVQAGLLMQGAVLLSAGGLAVADIIGGGHVTQFVLASRNDSELKLWSLSYMAGLLILIALTSYFIIARSSQKSSESLAGFVARNFSYLRNLSFGSDLLVKFSIVTLLIVINKPEFVAPLLFLFTGDFLLQGRFLNLPLKVSMVAGALCFVASIVQYRMHSPELVYPLISFSLLTAASMMRLAQAARMRGSSHESR